MAYAAGRDRQIARRRSCPLRNGARDKQFDVSLVRLSRSQATTLFRELSSGLDGYFLALLTQASHSSMAPHNRCLRA